MRVKFKIPRISFSVLISILIGCVPFGFSTWELYKTEMKLREIREDIEVSTGFYPGNGSKNNIDSLEHKMPFLIPEDKFVNKIDSGAAYEYINF